MMIPIHATLLPNYKIYNTLGLTDTIWALLIPYVAFSLPQGLFLMTGFIDSIPWEMEEAAVMDGCGIYRIVFQIITPMLKPSIATVAISGGAKVRFENIIVGSLLYIVLSSGLTMMGFTTQLMQLIQGVVFLVFVAVFADRQSLQVIK